MMHRFTNLTLILFFLISIFSFAQKEDPNKAFKNLVEFYNSLRGNSSQNKFRHQYVRQIRYLTNFLKTYEGGYNPKREEAKFLIAQIYRDLAFISGIKSDFIIAYNKINNFVSQTSDQVLADRARKFIEEIKDYAKEKKISQITKEVNKDRSFEKNLNNSLTYISNIYMFKNSITVHTDKPIKYLVTKSEKSNNAEFEIEIQNARLNTGTFRKPFFKDSKISNLKVNQYNSKSIRITFSSEKELISVVTENLGGKKINFAVRPADIVSKAKQELSQRAIVLIDPGHGGKDPGTIKNGTKEKFITLKVAKVLGEFLSSNGYKVFYTRSKDEFLSLNERADLSKKIKPDIFISLHANSSLDKGAGGIETYYFDVKSDDTTKKIAMQENQNSGPISDLDFILRDLEITNNFHDSGILAAKVHTALTSAFSRKKDRIFKNRGIRGGPFYLLYRTGVPSILIETGFLSNKKDAAVLNSNRYQNLIAKQIKSGIEDYIKNK